jgi:anti-sigma factor RsiW
VTRPSSYRAHLDETAAALVDGELGHSAREAALAHLAHCQRCRAQVEEQRRTKAQLSRTTFPTMSDELTGRLRAIGSTPVAGRPAPPPATANRRPPSPAGRRRPSGRQPWSGSRRSRTWAAATGVAASLVLGLGTAFVAGGAPSEGPAITPAVDRFAVEHAATTGGVSFPGSAVGAAVSASFAGSNAP